MHKLRVLFLLTIPVICGADCVTQFSESSLAMLMNERRTIEVLISGCSNIQNLTINVEHEGYLAIFPNILQINGTTTGNFHIDIKALTAGETSIYLEPLPPEQIIKFVKVQVYKSELLEVLSIIVGWTYFFCWTISMYPQVLQNFRRKSVVGFNFDSVVINITGYALYSIFGIGLYYGPVIRKQYEERNPFSIIAVQPNDVFFGIHGLLLSSIKGAQCLCYDTGGQTISWFAKWFHYITAVILIVSGILSLTNKLEWLDFLYICSYIKLAVTFCKYGPQAIMNYKRKSTDGWSIEAVLLDIVGGLFSVLQMFMNAYNYDQKLTWIFKNPAKLWLGISSLLFDLLFVVQHYCLYNKKWKNKRQDENDVKVETTIPLNQIQRLQE
ncbi:PQ loop repeat [Popillia japonica]|uniref:PQ loop repeat n=1 Tax=Popillia japonica TaxID=7064 RepID=A0AAW1JKG6_POPJA